MLNAAVAAFYYLRVVVYMYMRDPQTEIPKLVHGRLVWAGLAVATVLTIVLGLFPNTLLDIVSDGGGGRHPDRGLTAGYGPARSCPGAAPGPRRGRRRPTA